MADENTPDLQSGDNQEKPEWLPEKFDSPEALAKSYKELESKLGELSERARQADALEENYNELAARFEQFEQQQPRQQPTNQLEALMAEYEDAYNTGDARRLLAINARVSQLAVQEGLQQALPQVNQQLGTLAKSQADEIGAYAARTLESRYGAEAWEAARETMAQVIHEKPWLIPEAAQTDPRAAVDALDVVYRTATYGSPTPEPQSNTLAQQIEEMKQLAQSARGAGTRVLTPDEAKQEWEAIRAAGGNSYSDRRG